jgi:hypothetical protein
MYQPPSRYDRTPAERADEGLSWARPDERFFAAGACHILAWTFIDAHPEAGFRPVGLRLVGEPHVWHVYVTNDTWAFDYYGWVSEPELLEATAAEKRASGEDRPLERVELPENLDVFCEQHRHRKPAEFARLPWQRAVAYLAKFPPDPPTTSAF